MKPLTIALVKNEKRRLRSIGWKTPTKDHWRRQFYALDNNGKPLVAMLLSVM